MSAPFERRVVVDGNDGTGKSTLVRALRQLGFARVEDRAEMTRATDDASVGPAPDTTYLLVVCPWRTSLARLTASGADMGDEYHQPAALEHYDRVFRTLAEPFGAAVIDTEDLDPPGTLAAALAALCGGPFRVGLPKGRLPESAVAALLPPLTRVELAPPASRTLVFEAGPFLVMRGRTKVYPQLCAFGELDVALTGSDTLAGSPYEAQVEVIASTPQPGVRVVVASADGTIPERPLLRVASELRQVASAHFAARGTPHTVFALSGATEGFVPRFADVIVDIVETGQTLRDNGLSIVEELFALETCLIRRRLP